MVEEIAGTVKTGGGEVLAVSTGDVTGAATESIAAEAAIEGKEIVALGATEAAVMGVWTVEETVVGSEGELLAETTNFGAGLRITSSLLILA